MAVRQPTVVRGAAPTVARRAEPTDSDAPNHTETLSVWSSSTKPVGTLLLDGTDDPRAMMRRGAVHVRWNSRLVRKFRERPLPHVVDADMALPTLYLHFLDRRFFPEDGKINSALRSGNDNAEVVLVLPDTYIDGALPGVDESVQSEVDKILDFLQTQGEVQCTPATARAGSFGSVAYIATMNSEGLYFRLHASRPKCPVTLDKPAFGIPTTADMYLFAENHKSVYYMPEPVREAFEVCIQELPNVDDDDARALATFFKVFYEGGFAYNQKQHVGSGAYLPKCVGVGALGVTPAFAGQAGIATGYPYFLQHQFVRYFDTVPVTIGAIRDMSTRHGRYGVCYTRCVFVWDGGALEAEGTLDFCAPAPHGGFVYVPANPSHFYALGGLMYAFGEARDELESEVCLEAPQHEREPAREGGTASEDSALARAEHGDRRVCVVCISEDASMACVPCGHRAYCQECAKHPQCRDRPCPVCRAPVTAMFRVY